MKPALSSSYQHIAEDARDTVHEAALRAGLPVAEWLRMAADSASPGAAPYGSADRPMRRSSMEASAPDAALAAVHHRLEEFSALLGSRARPDPDATRTTGLRALESRLSELAQNLSRLGDEAPRRIADSITRLNGRLDRLIEEGRAASTDFEQRLAAVDSALAALQSDSARFSATTWSIEAALTEIEDRQRLIDAAADMPGDSPSSPISLAGLEQELRQLTKQMQSLRQASAADDGVSELRRELGLIKQSLADAMPRRAVEALEAEIRLLASRVNDGRNRGVESAGLANIERNLAKICDTLAGLAPAENLLGIERNIGELARKIDRVASNSPTPAMMRPLETAIAELRNLSTRVASGQALSSLATEVRGLAERIDRFVGPDGNAATGENEQAGDSAPDEQDLGKLRKSYIENNRRARASLEGVHSMMDRLIGRLGVAEGKTERAASADGGKGHAADPADAGKSAAATNAAHEKSGWLEDAPATNAASGPAILHDEISPPVAPDEPIEPGSGHPSAIKASPADRIAASEALHPGKPAAPTDAGSRSNFIAAARRAARAAAEEADDPRGRYQATGPASDQGKRRKRKGAIAGAGIILLLAGASALTMNFVGFEDIAAIGAPKRVAQAGAPSAAANSRSEEPVLPATETASIPAAVPAGNAATDGSPGGQTAQMSLLNATDAVAFAAPASGMLSAGPARDVNAFPGANSPLIPTPPAPTDVTGSTPKPQTMAAVDPAAFLAVPPAAPAGPDAILPEIIGGPRLRAAALAGDPTAAYEIALRFAEARGVPRNLEAAAQWFQRAADRGLAPAQYRLGSLYEKGRGVKRDLGAARRYYQAAADRGNAKAMHNLAVLYAEGAEGKPDYRTAAEWFRKAAARGVTDSQYNLGILYARGIGVPQSLAESYKWFMLAAQQGDQDAARKRDDVTARLEPQALVAAKLAVQTFTVEPQPQEAVAVPAPAGGWDQAGTAPAPAKPNTGAASRKKNAS